MITAETHIYQVRLTDSLLSTLHFQSGKDNSMLAWVDGYISYERGAEKADILMSAGLNTSSIYFVLLYQNTIITQTCVCLSLAWKPQDPV